MCVCVWLKIKTFFFILKGNDIERGKGIQEKMRTNYNMAASRIKELSTCLQMF